MPLLKCSHEEHDYCWFRDCDLGHLSLLRVQLSTYGLPHTLYANIHVVTHDYHAGVKRILGISYVL